jgi:hypothetical protein
MFASLDWEDVAKMTPVQRIKSVCAQADARAEAAAEKTFK